MSQITGANNPSAIATVVAVKTLPRLKANTVAYACANTDFEDEVRGFGDTVNVAIPAEFTTNLLSQGGTINRQRPTLGNASIVLSQHREVSWEHNDVNVAFASPDLRGTSAGQAIANFCEDVDEDLLSIYTSFATNVGAYNTGITEVVVDGAETAMFDARVGEGEKHLIVTGTGYSSIRSLPRFSERQTAGPGKTDPTSAKIKGTIKDFHVYRAQKTNVTSGTNRHGVALSPAALLAAVRPLGDEQATDGTIQVEVTEDNMTIRMTQSYNHDTLGGLATFDMLYGFVAGRTNHGIEVRH